MTKSQEYYRKHRKQILKQKKVYYIKNKIAIAKAKRKRRLKNRAKTRRLAHAVYIRSRSKQLAYKRIYRKKNKKKLRIVMRVYYQANRKSLIKKQTIRERKRLRTDLQLRLSKNLRRRINLAIKNNQKKGSAVKDLGCTIEFFKKYIEVKFYDKMTWGNYGSYWVIDHIKELWEFDLIKRSEFLKAVNYKNMQPLTKPDHIKKTIKNRLKRQRNKNAK